MDLLEFWKLLIEKLLLFLGFLLPPAIDLGDDELASEMVERQLQKDRAAVEEQPLFLLPQPQSRDKPTFEQAQQIIDYNRWNGQIGYQIQTTSTIKGVEQREEGGQAGLAKVRAAAATVFEVYHHKGKGKQQSQQKQMQKGTLNQVQEGG